MWKIRKSPKVPASWRMRFALAAIVISLAGCESLIGIGGGGGGGTELPPEVELPTGVVQHVTVTPESPESGADIVVRSVLRNDGATVLPLSSRICGLNWGGSLRVAQTPNVATCAGWGVTVNLAPGDSLVTHAYWRVMSLPGSYVLNVGHVLTTNYLHPVPVVVQ